MLPLWGLLLLLYLFPAANALSSWYTEPGSSSPAGSTAGDKVRGVNLGGWLLLENWMQPSLFEVSPLDQHYVLDEWQYCTILGKEECYNRLSDHWDTYLTEDDFARFANYSLNTVRIPIGYWPWIDLEDYEPFVQGQTTYLDRALEWSDKYGLDVMLDLHSLPGGQNGQDNQGFKGPIEFQYNQTNMDRALAAVRNMTSYVTADRFNGVVKAIELVNEPYILEYSASGMSFDQLASYYVQAYQAVRDSEYIADGANEVMVVIHDAFQAINNWDYFFSTDGLGLNWTNYALDTHIYDAFGTSASKTWQEHLDTICAQSAALTEAQQKFPVIVGEFSLGIGTYCVDYQSCWSQTLESMMANLTDYETSLFYRQFWEVQQDVYELAAGWIFWSFANEYGAPWSWSQSAAQNWIPEDPSEKIYPFYSTYSASCLDTSNPLDGDQNMPYFPNYTNPVSNINITYVLNKYSTEAQTGNTTSNATSSSASASASSAASASASSTAHSGSAGRANLVSLSLLGGILVGAGGLIALW